MSDSIHGLYNWQNKCSLKQWTAFALECYLDLRMRRTLSWGGKSDTVRVLIGSRCHYYSGRIQSVAQMKRVGHHGTKSRKDVVPPGGQWLPIKFVAKPTLETPNLDILMRPQVHSSAPPFLRWFNRHVLLSSHFPALRSR